MSETRKDGIYPKWGFPLRLLSVGMKRWRTIK